MEAFDFNSIAAELGKGVTAEDAESMLQDDNERIRDRMESRRAIMQAQVRADEIKSKLCDKIQEEKRKVPGLKERVAALETSDPDIFTYIRKLEIIQDGIWCPRCNLQKSIGGRKQDAEVGIEPKTQYDIDALHAYESAVLQKLRQDYESFENKIVHVFEDVSGAQRDFDSRYESAVRNMSTLLGDLKEMQDRAKQLSRQIGQAPNVFMQSPLEAQPRQSTPLRPAPPPHPFIPSQPQQSPQPHPDQAEKKTFELPPKPTYDLESIVENAYSHTLSASDLLGD